MVAPTLSTLPTEILDKIIEYARPEGFEGMTLTCRQMYETCKPFFEHYNQRRALLQDFAYNRYPADARLSPRNPTALDLITHIANEPVVARYIRHADLTCDTWPTRSRPVQVLPDVDSGGPVVALFADSPYLRQAGLDWKEYYALIQDDLEQLSRYSQHAAAFLLTLLPNVESLQLPRLWQKCEEAEQLLGTIVHIAAANQSIGFWDRPSLARLVEFEPYSSTGIGHEFGLDQAIPFLALPKVRSFHGRSCVTADNTFIEITSRDPYLNYGARLETVRFESSCIDEVAIAAFLKHTPRLRKFKYSHCTRGRRQDWNICQFATAIESGAGRTLEELSISIPQLDGSIIPGRASMRGFQRLQKLEFPLEIAMCNVAQVPSNLSTADKDLQQATEDLVPASVSRLSLLSNGTDRHEKALKIMFSSFATRKQSWVPALKHLHISLERGADDAFKEEFNRVKAEAEGVGVEVQ